MESPPVGRAGAKIGHLLAIVLWCWIMPVPAIAWLDLSAAAVERLDNGLTLIVLEDHSFPVVSVQSLYRVGARNETAGATGLAHFLEHMAFRDSENFPDSRLVSDIYAVGGEWHGYTWLDQTTYFSTAPREQLNLLLRIEADRMARVTLSEADVLVERGAVITEMHGYENDPASVLNDHVMYLAFLAHPYRNNTIGWESDVAQMSHADLLAFYQRHYHPGNAILTVVGDVNAENIIRQVQGYFGALPARAPTPAPHTVEPAQTGERRLVLQGEVERKHFKIAWRAPSASNPDYPAFLLAQELLAGGSGVSFLQNDWGTAVRPNSPLAGIADDLSTWFPPSAQDYVFVISGSVPGGTEEDGIEQAIEKAILQLQRQLSAGGEGVQNQLEQARQGVRRELVFDVQTTEDAAHQLAFFAGLDALDVLLELPQSLEQVRAADLARVIAAYLQPEQRNIAWYVPAPEEPSGLQVQQGLPGARAPAEQQQAGENPSAVAPASRPSRPAKAGIEAEASSPRLARLANGLPVMLQYSPLSPTVSLRVVTPLAQFPASSPARPHHPAWGLASLDYELLPDELGAAIAQARVALAAATPWTGSNTPDQRDPAAVMERYFTDVLGLEAASREKPLAPLLLIVSGDIDLDRVAGDLERGFGSFTVAPFAPPPPLRTSQTMDIESTLAVAVAQEQLGYVVQAPAPDEPAAAAWQMVLYILSHGYEGRLGKEAIAERGLIYYIDSAYQTDGRNGWISLGIGVDPDKLPAMKQLLRETLAGLVSNPPSQQEVDEARKHLLGRHVSAAQSNMELADRLARDWLWYGQALTYEELHRRLNAVRRQDIIELLPAFIDGTTVSIRNPKTGPEPTSTLEAIKP